MFKFFQNFEAPWWEKVTLSLHPSHDGFTMCRLSKCHAFCVILTHWNGWSRDHAQPWISNAFSACAKGMQFSA